MSITPVKLSRLPANYAGQLARLSFTDWVDRPAFAYRSIDEWKDVTDRLLSVAFPAAAQLHDDTGHRVEVEQNILKKMIVCWRAKGYGSAFQEEPISQPLRLEQVRALMPFIRKVCERALVRIRAMTVAERRSLSIEKGYPIRKGKGAPFFLTSKDSDLVPALVAMHNQGSIVEANWECEVAQGYGTPMAGATLIRLQATKAERARYEYDGQKLVYVAKDFWGPKTRKVTGLPFAWNFWQAPIFALAREGYVGATGRGSGTLSHVVRAILRPGVQAVALDASTFDDSVGLPAIDAIIEHLFDPITRILEQDGTLSAFHAQRARDSVRVASRTAVITPPGNREEGARLIQNSDGVLSGLRGTSVIDTIFTAAMVEYYGSRLGLKLGVDYEYDTFGDDTLVLNYVGNETSRRWATAFEGAKDELGVTYERAEEATFLFRRIPSLKPYLGRMLLRTINREEREEPESLEAAVLGISSRLDLMRGDSQSQAIYLQALKAAGGPDNRLCRAAELAASITPRDLPKLANAAASRKISRERFLDDLLEQQRRGVLPAALAPWAAQAEQLMYQPWREILSAAQDLDTHAAARAIRKRMSQQADAMTVRRALSK